MRQRLASFLTGVSGAISVDYTVLSAAAVAMALGAAAVLDDTVRDLTQRLDAELRTRQLGADFIQYEPAFFEPLLADGRVTEAQAEALYAEASATMNQDLIDALALGIAAMQDGPLSDADLAELHALAVVAYQRNIIDAVVLEAFFGIPPPG